MAKWYQPFFFWLQNLCVLLVLLRPSKTPIRPDAISNNWNPKIPWIHPQFYSTFWRNNPRHALSLQKRAVGAQKGRFCLFPLCPEGIDKKTLNLRFFAKKQVNFRAVYLLRCKPLIINENMMMHRENRSSLKHPKSDILLPLHRGKIAL